MYLHIFHDEIGRLVTEIVALLFPTNSHFREDMVTLEQMGKSGFCLLTKTRGLILTNEHPFCLKGLFLQTKGVFNGQNQAPDFC